MPEEVKKPVKQPIESQISYQKAYSLFQDRNFGFFPRGDYTEFVIPIVMTVKRFRLPPDAFAVYLNTKSSKVYLYSPSPDGGREQVSDKLSSSEISWITEFLNHKGEKFNDKTWSLSQKDFYVLEVLCQEKHRTARKNITTEYRPYTPTGKLLEVIEAFSQRGLLED